MDSIGEVGEAVHLVEVEGSRVVVRSLHREGVVLVQDNKLGVAVVGIRPGVDKHKADTA